MGDHGQTPVPNPGIERRAWEPWMSLAPVGILALWALVAPSIVYVAARARPSSPSGCTGLGFGCTPDPMGSAVLFMLLFGAPVLIGVLIVVLVMTFLKASLRSRLWVAALLPPTAGVIGASVL